MKFSGENKVVSTRIGIGPNCTTCRQIVIDFAGPALDAIPENSPPQAIASCSTNAVIAGQSGFSCPRIERLARRFENAAQFQANTDPVDLRCTLQKGTNILSETWTYQWSPP